MACGCPEGCFPNFPFATVTMTVPPPIILPTTPSPVKPLQLPCPQQPEDTCIPMLPDRDRTDNYYNNYNIDYHPPGKNAPPAVTCIPKKPQRPCEDYSLKDKRHKNKGCPTGFKPCVMNLTPPPCCDPCGVWCAKVQPCPPKSNKGDCTYRPGPCTRPCCIHYHSDDHKPCLYGGPCKAHCFETPTEMRHINF